MSISRRSLLTSAAALVGLSKVPSLFATDPPAKPASKTAFTFAHLTDIHITPDLNAPAGLASCIKTLTEIEPRPDFALTGGDLIMDALGASAAEINLQWQLFDTAFEKLPIPVYHTIGNHDIGGWAPNPRVAPDAPEFGKALFAKKYGKGNTYQSFDHKGWHFILLDSIGFNQNTKNYYGVIDDTQIAWLREDLEKAGRTMPIIISTHIPFFSTWYQMHGNPPPNLLVSELITNAHVVHKILQNYNVKLVLSGHGHLSETIQMSHGNRATFIQGGAVCGHWWKGPYHDNPEGFGVIQCTDDGQFSYAYHPYPMPKRR